ncbi:MAG: hypothetical protein VX589_12865 [Myxococcota bacterium]|nr:hypothetical protein [Myxococcota bacterium]
MSMWRVFLVTVLCWGCGPDFDPRELLKDYRVIGIVAEPPEVSVADTLTVTAIEHVPSESDQLERVWSVCLLSAGVFADFDCLSPDFEIELATESATFDLSLAADGIDFLTTLFEGLEGVDGLENTDDMMDCGDNCQARDGTETTYIDIQLRLRSGPASGPKMTTIKAVRVNFEPDSPNQNPVITAFQVNGLARPDNVAGGESLRLSVDLDDESFESYLEASSGVTQTEQPIMTWYTTQGELEKNITTGDRRETILNLPDTIEGDAVDVYVVVRDGRGGTDFRALTLTTEERPR